MGKGQEVLINGAFASVRVDRDRERKGEEGKKGREGGEEERSWRGNAGIRGLAAEGIGGEGERRNGGRKRKIRG